MTGRGKGKEVALQTEVDSQEDWEEVISKEGLTGTGTVIWQYTNTQEWFQQDHFWWWQWGQGL